MVELLAFLALLALGLAGYTATRAHLVAQEVSDMERKVAAALEQQKLQHEQIRRELQGIREHLK